LGELPILFAGLVIGTILAVRLASGGSAFSKIAGSLVVAWTPVGCEAVLEANSEE
jgi:hypothetical protein